MLTAEPPRIIFEQVASCSEGAGAPALFSEAVGASRGPEPGWTVHVRLAERQGGRSAVGELWNPAGLAVVHRVFTTAGTACAPLSRAIGLWVALALDDEVARASKGSPSASPKAKASDLPAEGAPTQAHLWLLPASAAPPPPAVSDAIWPDGKPPDPPSPEESLFLRHRDGGSRSFELGASGFFMDTGNAGGLVGPSLFGMAELDGGFYLRPMLAYGVATGSGDGEDVAATSSWYIARVDTCGRIPGYYRDRRGIQLDLCGGTEGGSFMPGAPAASLRPFWAIGPALALRGELASDLSAELRGTGLWEIVRRPFTDASGADRRLSPIAERIEVALSWRLQ